MKIEEGKYYTDRVGAVWGPMRRIDKGLWRWGDAEGHRWTAAGRYLVGEGNPKDLVAEVPTAPPTSAPQYKIAFDPKLPLDRNRYAVFASVGDHWIRIADAYDLEQAEAIVRAEARSAKERAAYPKFYDADGNPIDASSTEDDMHGVGITLVEANRPD